MQAQKKKIITVSTVASVLQIFLCAFPVLASIKIQGIHSSLLLLEGSGAISLQESLL